MKIPCMNCKIIDIIVIKQDKCIGVTIFNWAKCIEKCYKIVYTNQIMKLAKIL